jgi:hypothetical protein
VLRASAVAEKAGIPSVTLVCEGFVAQASSTSVGLGLPELPLAVVPGHVDVQSAEEMRSNVVAMTAGQVAAGLTKAGNGRAIAESEPSPADIVFTGSFEEVNDFFYQNEWSEGLPVVPPTAEKIGKFLQFTDRRPDESLGVLLPDSRSATVWSVAANGVMAGCRPEYMPILVALIEAMADPSYGVEHSGNTPGSETLIILNGPIIKELGFNYEQGALRDGFQANTSIGRFWRLYLRNGAGFLPHKTDKGTFGNTWRVVLAENEDALASIGWEPVAADFGFKAGDNTVTISRFTGGDVIASVHGESAERLLPYLVDAVTKQVGWELIFTVGMATSTLRLLLVLSPILAKIIAATGYPSKRDLKQYLFDHARIPAWKFENYISKWTHLTPGNRTLVDMANMGRAAKVFAESSDPNRMVPIVGRPEDFMIAVSGDPLRTNAYTFSHNGILGYSTARKIQLLENWKRLLRETGSK